ncbi:MAG TPA: hypothetical protein VLH35_04205 [Candidatus Acidoferrales bacterium]|nr:hypothetical protein [Candidatus Acidoferrales bacterium]
MTAEAPDALPPYARFQNGWYCPKCDKLTEHTQKHKNPLSYGQQICNLCGHTFGKPKPAESILERKLNEKIHRLKRQIEQQKKDPKKELWTARLEKTLSETKEELSKIQTETCPSRETKFNRDQKLRVKSP